MDWTEGIGISGYRSFGSDMQRMGPLRKINLLIGQNNVGKSNILTFVSKHYLGLVSSVTNKHAELTFTEIDQHKGDEPQSLKFEVGIEINGAVYDQSVTHLPPKLQSIRAMIEKILKSQALTHGTPMAWIPYTSGWQGPPKVDATIINPISEDLLEDEWFKVWTTLTGMAGGSLKVWISETLGILVRPAVLSPPVIHLIPAIRKIGDSGTSPHDYSGVGIIDRLAELQNPSYGNEALKDKFNDINLFVQSVLDDADAVLEIPADKSMILVNKDGRRLPLSSLGTGLHEVITLSVAATVLNDTLLCLEEPELHLHPLLQKKLIRYLATKTTNRYLISTHSAHFLDTPEAQIFHVKLVRGRTLIDSAGTNSALSSICDDLGYRPSDLLQSNCIIWVEGPSDRIYLNHWILALDNGLLEGIQYSIMFYGGRLLSHLTAEDPEVTDFISLRRLNRHMVIVLDSDRTNKKDELNETKKRIASEFSDGIGFAWVTQGREIENYISHKLLETSLQDTHPRFKALGNTGIYDKVYRFKKEDDSIVEEVDKVKLAHSVAQKTPELGLLDLEMMMRKVIVFIHEANGTK